MGRYEAAGCYGLAESRAHLYVRAQAGAEAYPGREGSEAASEEQLGEGPVLVRWLDTACAAVRIGALRRARMSTR